jgi:hypothetical protein
MENRNAASQGVCASADVYEQRSLLPPRQDEGDRESAGPFIPSRLSHAFGLGFQGFSSLASPSHFTPRPADNACLHRGSAWRFAGRTVGADFFFSQTHISRCAKLLHPPPDRDSLIILGQAQETVKSSWYALRGAASSKALLFTARACSGPITALRII